MTTKYFCNNCNQEAPREQDRFLAVPSGSLLIRPVGDQHFCDTCLAGALEGARKRLKPAPTTN